MNKPYENKMPAGVESFVEEASKEEVKTPEKPAPEQPKSDWKQTKMASGVLHEQGKNRIIEESTPDFKGKQYRIGGTQGKIYNSLDEAKNSFNQEQSKSSYTPFKLDRAKYSDVETTPYGFVYNVGGQSITDMAGQAHAFGEHDPNKKYGWTRTTDSGDEVVHESFEDAYNAIKGGKAKLEKKPINIEELNHHTFRLSEMGRLTQNARKKGQSPQQVLDSVAYDMDIKPNTEEYEELKEYAMFDSRLNKETGQYEYNKYNVGSDKQLTDPKDRFKMQELVEGLKKAGLKNVKLYDGYEDYGAGMKWTAPLADDTWVLSPRQWIDYMNGNASIDEIVKQVKNGEYSDVFQWEEPTFKEETSVKKLVDVIDKYMGKDDETSIDIVNNAMERLEQLVKFSPEEVGLIASGTGEQIIDILRSKIPQDQE